MNFCFFLIWTTLLQLILSLWHFGTKLLWLSFTSCRLQRGNKGHKWYLLAFQWQKQKTVGKFYCLVWKNYIPAMGSLKNTLRHVNFGWFFAIPRSGKNSKSSMASYLMAFWPFQIISQEFRGNKGFVTLPSFLGGQIAQYSQSFICLHWPRERIMFGYFKDISEGTKNLIINILPIC